MYPLSLSLCLQYKCIELYFYFTKNIKVSKLFHVKTGTKIKSSLFIFCSVHSYFVSTRFSGFLRISFSLRI
jgi:hypothetical protein